MQPDDAHSYILVRMVDDPKDPDDPDRNGNTETKELVDPGSHKKSVPAPATVLPPAVIQALRSQNIDINVLLVQVASKSHDVEQAANLTERLLEVSSKFEAQRIKNFEASANAIIGAKTKDPDEIDKRRNNATRRTLKRVIALASLASIGGGITVACRGGSLMMVGLLLTVGFFALAVMAVLASGESMTANDVAVVANVIKSFPFGGNGNQGQNQLGGKKKRS